MPRVGILALQGDFAAHSQVLEALQVPWQLVKTPADLAQVAGLIIPGGESTTLLKLMAAVRLRPALEQFHAEGQPIFGTCAGLIVLAQETIQPHQERLGFIDLVAARNAYGRQIDSFMALGAPLDVADVRGGAVGDGVYSGTEDCPGGDGSDAAGDLSGGDCVGTARECVGVDLPS